MPITADRPARRTTSSGSPSQRLRANFAAARVSFTWLGVRKTLTADQKAQAAEQFDADATALSAGKKLLDTRHDKFKAVTAIKNRIGSYWKYLTLPFPEPGLRLIRQGDIESFTLQMRQFKSELDEAVEDLNHHYADLRSAARERLGTLYNDADYPPTLVGMFDVQFDFPSVEPPEYLLRLSPQLYQEERQRIAARFDEAVRLAEEAFTAEFAKLVSHLVERLGSEADGTRKVFRDSAIGNLTEFFQRFRNLDVGSSQELDRLVETAKKAISGVEPQAVRDSDGLRQHVATQLSAVSASLEQLLVDQPRRRILRPAREGS